MSLFSAKSYLKRITDVTPQLLDSMGVKALLIDVDNTLSTHHGKVLISGVYKWLERMKQNGIGMIIVSNSKFKRIKPFSEKIGLPFVSLAAKPLPFGYIKAAKLLGVKRKECAIIGDQLFTDILGANLCGIQSVRVSPVKLEDGISFKIRRYFEKKILKERF